MQALGLNLQWFIFQIIDFCLLFFGLTYFLHKPIVNLLDKRRQEIKDNLELGEKVRNDLVKLSDTQKELLESARKEASQVLSLAKEQGQKLEKHIQVEAKNQAELILNKASQEIKQEHLRLKNELKGELTDLVIQVSQKIMAEEIPRQKQKQITKLLEEIK